MSNDHIDSEGFRANVGIILSNDDGRLLLAGRVGSKGWQFPQGGMLQGESPEQAMYRELHEEVGLTEDDVSVLGSTDDWLRYRLPKRYVRLRQRVSQQDLHQDSGNGQESTDSERRQRARQSEFQHESAYIVGRTAGQRLPHLCAIEICASRRQRGDSSHQPEYT